MFAEVASSKGQVTSLNEADAFEVSESDSVVVPATTTLLKEPFDILLLTYATEKKFKYIYF